MRRRQTLSKLFREIADLLDEEAATNPRFAARLDTLVSSIRGPAEARRSRNRRPSTTPPVPDVLSALEQKGDEEFRFWLRSLDIPTLKAIIKSNGFDVARASQRWTDPDKFITLIAQQAGARLKRGSGFLLPRPDGGRKGSGK